MAWAYNQNMNMVDIRISYTDGLTTYTHNTKSPTITKI